MGRWKAAALAAATAAVAAVLGFGGLNAAAAPALGAPISVQTSEPPIACGTTNAEYAQAPPDCNGTGGGAVS
jgi:hypothetical protein